MDELTTVLEKLKEILQTVLDEEEEALGNLPESFQEGERGQQMQEYISIMEEVIDKETWIRQHSEPIKNFCAEQSRQEPESEEPEL